MSEPLSREQVEIKVRTIVEAGTAALSSAADILDHDATQRARIAARDQENVRLNGIEDVLGEAVFKLQGKLATVTAERDELNNVLRQAGWGQGEIDSAAYTFDKMAKANTALVVERDRLREDAAKDKESFYRRVAHEIDRAMERVKVRSVIARGEAYDEQLQIVDSYDGVIIVRMTDAALRGEGG